MKNTFRTILDTGTCTCIFEPRGDCGLEGYFLNNNYRYEYIQQHKQNMKDKKYYRVYPTSDHNEYAPDYYECCSRANFNKYFSI